MQELSFTLKFSIPVNKSYCDSCSVAKAHRLPFSLPKTIAQKPFDLVHGDVWGPTLLLLVWTLNIMFSLLMIALDFVGFIL